MYDSGFALTTTQRPDRSTRERFMRPLACGSVGLLLMGLGGLGTMAGCDKDTRDRTSEGVPAGNKPKAGFGAISPEDLEALRAEITRFAAR